MRVVGWKLNLPHSGSCRQNWPHLNLLSALRTLLGATTTRDGSCSSSEACAWVSQTETTISNLCGQHECMYILNMETTGEQTLEPPEMIFSNVCWDLSINTRWLKIRITRVAHDIEPIVMIFTLQSLACSGCPRLVIEILVRMTNQCSEMTKAKKKETKALLKKTTLKPIGIEWLRWVGHCWLYLRVFTNHKIPEIINND